MTILSLKLSTEEGATSSKFRSRVSNARVLTSLFRVGWFVALEVGVSTIPVSEVCPH